MTASSNNTGYDFDVVFTLEARSNILLDVITEHYRLSENQVYKEIHRSIRQLKGILSDKGVPYADLKTALVPSKNRQELVLVFDWRLFEAGSYGREVVHKLLPLLNRKSSHSILCGDWVSKYRFSDILGGHYLKDQAESILIRHSGSPDTLYFVYLNNLTLNMAAKLDDAFYDFSPYLGALDMTFQSDVKAFLSTMLVRAFIKHRGNVIQGHEDDRPASENVNLLGYEFRKSGYKNRSVPSWLYGMFLSYKIERPVIKYADNDTRFSLNTLSPYGPQRLDDFEVVLEDSKLRHLQKMKGGSLKKADIQNLTTDEVTSQIRKKLEASYIYNLARAKDGDTLKFNIIIENDVIARNICALECRPLEKILRVITFY